MHSVCVCVCVCVRTRVCVCVCAFIVVIRGSIYSILLNFSDVNECGLDKGGCDHKCINRGGSYHCACAEGYSLQIDNRTCVAGNSHIFL